MVTEFRVEGSSGAEPVRVEITRRRISDLWKNSLRMLDRLLQKQLCFSELFVFLTVESYLDFK